MAKFTPYAVTSLPPIPDDNGVYFEQVTPTTFKVAMWNSSAGNWAYVTGASAGVDSLNSTTGVITIKPDLNNITGNLTLDVNGTLSTGVNLDSRFRKLTDDIPWSEVGTIGDPVPGFVTLSGPQTITSTKTIATGSKLILVDSPVSSTDAANKQYVDNLISGILTGALYKGDIDASLNPNYPASTEIGNYWFISAPGKIGGPSGPTVDIGDMIIAKAVDAGGTHAAVGNNRSILENNKSQATESISGILKIASNSDVSTGTNDTNAVTPLKLATRIATLISTSVGLGTSNTVVPSQNAVKSYVDTAISGISVPGASTSIILNGGNFQRAALTGDVVASQNNNSTTISNQAVTYAKIQNVGANSILGNNTGSSGIIKELSASESRALLSVYSKTELDGLIAWGAKDW